MKKNRWGILLGLLLVLMLSGCGKKKTEIIPEGTDYIGDVTENTLTFHADGTIDQVLCEAMADAEGAAGAEQFVRNEIDSFNQSVGVSKISLLQIETEGVTVKAAIRYSDLESYRGFNLVEAELSDYDQSQADEAARAMQPTTEAVKITQQDLSEINESELIEAGINPEDVEAGLYTTEEEPEPREETAVTATFTDAEGNIVPSDSVPADRMMLFIDEETKVIFDGGTVFYVNGHGKILSSGAVKTDGKDTCIVIFTFY